MEKRISRNNYIIMACLVVTLLFIALSMGAPIAYADITQASNVLDDLRQDESFDVGLYPPKSDDYSINVIQIAETTNKELLVYAYQPCCISSKVVATSINISETDELDFKNYKLKLLSNSGVFYKYVVQNYTILDSNVRYYYITSIFRPYISGVDEAPEGDNTVDEVSFAVEKQYRFAGEGDNYTVDVKELETIRITDKFVGCVRYPDGAHFLYKKACDSHFVAFDTDRPIDKLYEADVYYIPIGFVGGVGIDNKKEEYVTLKSENKVVHNASGWGAGTYTWDEIESIDQFLDSNLNKYTIFGSDNSNLVDSSTLELLKNKKWVLRFLATDYSTPDIVGLSSYTRVKSVTILRLKFEYDGQVYNLGVIDNKQSGSGKPINNGSDGFDLFNWLEEHTGIPKGVWIAFACLIPIAILMPILSAVFPVFGQVLSMVLKVVGKLLVWFFKGLWIIICLPFKAIKAIIEKIQEHRG